MAAGRKTQTKTRKRAGATASASGKRLRRKSPVTAPEEPEPHHETLPAVWVNTAIGVLLLPFCWIATAALFHVFRTGGGERLWQSEAVWMFSAGFILWLPIYFFFPRPIGLYVVGHELTHALFIRLCGGRVGRIHTTREGGYVLTDKNNVLIALSPYFVPFWTLISLALLGTAGFFLEIPWFDRLLFFVTGVTWAFHLTFTLSMIRQGQPDIDDNGRFFSLTFVYLSNVLIIAAMLIVASPRVKARDFLGAARREGSALLHTASRVLPAWDHESVPVREDP